MESTCTDRGIYRLGRNPPLRSGAKIRPQDSLLSGVKQRDVREGTRDTAERNDTALSTESVWSGESVRALDHGELPRELQPVCLFGNSVQPRIAPSRPGVRDAQ